MQSRKKVLLDSAVDRLTPFAAAQCNKAHQTAPQQPERGRQGYRCQYHAAVQVEADKLIGGRTHHHVEGYHRITDHRRG